MKTFAQILREAKKLKKGDSVKNSKGVVGKIDNISSDGEIADVSWNKGGEESVPVKSLKIFEGASENTDLEFVVDQFVNNENASDNEMIAHLAKETGLELNAIKKMVKKERTNIMNKPLASTGAHVKTLKKYL